jgi:nicotinamidase-related amidase
MMKKLIALLFVVTVVFSNKCFSQASNSNKPERMRPALIVIDIQNAFLEQTDKTEAETAMGNINSYIGLFRQKGFPIIRVYHSDLKYGYGPKEGSEQFEFPKSVLIQPADAKVIKHYPDAFNKTDLDKILKEKKVNTVFLCGLSAVGCVLATYIGAENFDYSPFFLKDALISHKAAYTESIENIFAALGFEAVNIMLDNSEK